MRVALLCCLPRRGWFLVFRRTTTVCYMIPTCSCLNGVNTEQSTRSSFSASGNVKPGVDPERSDYRTLRAERGTCFNPLQALITPPSADWIHSSFLHLTPIQAKIKTCIALFEKCSVFTVLKLWKVSLRRREPCSWRESSYRRRNLSLWETRELIACGWWILWRSMWILWDDFFSLITFY